MEAQVFACRHSSVPVSRFIHSFCPRRHPSQLVAFKPAEARDKPWGNSRRRSAWPSAKAQIRYTTTTRTRRTPVHRSSLFWCMGGLAHRSGGPRIFIWVSIRERPGPQARTWAAQGARLEPWARAWAAQGARLEPWARASTVTTAPPCCHSPAEIASASSVERAGADGDRRGAKPGDSAPTSVRRASAADSRTST